MTLNEQCSCAASVRLPAGVYREKLHCTRPQLCLCGAGSSRTILTWNDAANDLLPSGERRGTFRSYTAYFGCEALCCENLTIANTAGDGDTVGQAIAAYVDCRHAFFRNVRFLGHQDTLFLTPLPPTPVIPGSFCGPNLGKPRLPTEAYFENCFISGTVDFIFGGGTAVFANCIIQVLPRANDAPGYLCAPSTDPEQPCGFLFRNCHITGDAPAFLARPWRAHGHAAFVKCTIEGAVCPAGFDDWNNPQNRNTARFSESAAAHCPERAGWSRALSPAEEQQLHALAAGIRVRTLAAMHLDNP